ncbi:MAG TPA: hypothetical protein VFN21_05890 [Acidimicrobiales bacterium]|nr:hypothetical protein [Acidimicrobiales bacterium]
MREAFTVLYSRLFLEALLVIGAVALIAGRLRRRLRVSPDQGTRAPVLWLVNFTADARLHRRLRRLAANARAAARGGSRHRRRRGSTPSQRLALDLEYEVVNLDVRLVESRSLDYDAQMAVVSQLRADADRIDGLIDRAATLVEREATDPSSTIAADPIGAIAIRLEELEAAGVEDAARVIDASGRPATPPAIETTALDSPS